MNRFIFTLFFFSISLSSIAQADEKSSLRALTELYNARIDSSAFIFTGIEYVIQSYRKSGTPFFLSDSLTPGNIRYAGQWYTNVPLQWDILQNYVLTRSLNGYSKIILRNDLIDSFMIQGHTIASLSQDKASNLQNADYYDKIYRGTIKVFARRKRETFSTINEDKIIYHFKDKDKFYIQKAGIFYRVANKREVLRILSGHTAAINRSVRREGLHWRKNFEASLIVAARQYDQLTH